MFELTTLNIQTAATTVLLAIAAEPVEKPDTRLLALDSNRAPALASQSFSLNHWRTLLCCPRITRIDANVGGALAPRLFSFAGGARLCRADELGWGARPFWVMPVWLGPASRRDGLDQN
jgi:hypothetical protein